MGNINRAYIEEYIRNFTREESFLEDIRKYGEDNSIPIIHPEVKNLIEVIVLLGKSKKILEIGTAIGYSSMVMASKQSEDGIVFTIERDQKMIDISKENIKRKGYSNRIELLEGDAFEVIDSNREKLKDLDLVFIDGAKGRYKDVLDKIIPLLNKEAIIISDNILFKGMVANDELVIKRKKTIVKRMKAYIEFIMQSDIFKSSIIPIGDGIILSYKK